MRRILCSGSAILACALLASAQPASRPLRIGVALPPTTGGLGLRAVVDALTAERLLSFTEEGKFLPRAASSWTRSADGTTWTFAIAEGLRLHSGRLAGAPEVAAMLRSGVADPRETALHPRLADITEIAAVGPSHVAVRSRTPRVLLLDELAQITLRTGNDALGPFVPVESRPELLRLRRFDGYHLGRAAVAEVEFRSYRSLRAAWSAVMREEVDAVYEISREVVEFVERASGIRIYSFLRPYASTLIFNVNRPALRQASTRQAISAAVDRDAMVRQALRGRGRVAGGPLRPDHWALGAGEAPTQVHDPAAAARALGPLPLQAATGQMPARARFECLVPMMEMQPFERIALMLQKQLYTVGLDLQLRHVTMPELQRRLSSGDFDMVLIEANGGSPGWLSAFWHSPVPGGMGFIKSGYSAADAELDAVQMARNERELKAAVGALYRKIVDDPPAVFIAWPTVSRAVSTRFDVPVEQGRDIMAGNLRLWRPAAATGGRR